MDILDLVIVALLVVAGAAGYRRGISWVFFSLVGLLIGLVAGTRIAQAVAAHTAAGNYGNRGLIGFGVFTGSVLVIQGIGTAIGFRARSATLRRQSTSVIEIDSVAGASLAVLGAMVAAWFLGIVFGGTAVAGREITGSFIEQSLAHIGPTIPTYLAPLRQILQGTEFPIAINGGFGNGGPPSADLPPSVDTPGIARATQSTVRVVAAGCGIEAGSAWPLGNGYFVTNAHVVAGAERVVLQQQGIDGDHQGTVVRYDPETDLAVILAPDLPSAGLPLASDDPAPGTTGAVIGYPGGGDRTVVPAAVRGEEDASGYDIYSANSVTRRIEVLNALVQPGNSGGPLVDQQGRVVGLVFAVSTSDPHEGYALSLSQIRAELDGVQNATAAVSTQACAQ